MKKNGNVFIGMQGLIVLVVSVGIVSISSAQGIQFGLYGAASMPLGDFESEGTKTGFGGGVEVAFPLASDLFLLTSASGIFNKGDDTGVKALEEAFGPIVDADVGYWINVPIMAGLKFETGISPTLKLYATGQGGVNLAQGPKMEMNFNFGSLGSGKTEMTSDFTTTFGFKFGGGAVINERITVGAYYLNLGKPEFKYTLKVDGEEQYSQDIPFSSVSLFLLTVGITF